MSESPRVCQVQGCAKRTTLHAVIVGGQAVAVACLVHRAQIGEWLAQHLMARDPVPVGETWRLVQVLDRAPVLVPPGEEAPM